MLDQSSEDQGKLWKKEAFALNFIGGSGMGLVCEGAVVSEIWREREAHQTSHREALDCLPTTPTHLESPWAGAGKLNGLLHYSKVGHPQHL